MGTYRRISVYAGWLSGADFHSNRTISRLAAITGRFVQDLYPRFWQKVQMENSVQDVPDFLRFHKYGFGTVFQGKAGVPRTDSGYSGWTIVNASSGNLGCDRIVCGHAEAAFRRCV